MITKDDMFKPLLAVCPGFMPTWQEFVREWENEKEGLPHYLALGDLARYLIQQFTNGETSEFAAVFDVVERWHREGDPYVRKAATIGFLEGLQNNSEHRGIDPKEFEPWLRPESKRWWEKLKRFWNDGEILTDH